jgi:GT2 family glycosyltransferase
MSSIGLSLTESPMGGTSAGAFEPTRVCDVELGEPLHDLLDRDPETHSEYKRASVLVRLHGEPIGLVRLTLPEGGLSAAEVAGRIATVLAREIGDHLDRDGLVASPRLTAKGLPGGDGARCAIERRSGSGRYSATVVITTRDRTRQLEAALESVFAMRHRSFDVVVVDNVPSDGSTEAMLKSRFARQDLNYVREDWPGIAAARNAGVREARGEVIAFTDDDVEVDPDWLSQLVAGFSAAADVGIVTGLTMPARLDLPVHEWFEEYGGFDKGFERRVVDLRRNRPLDDPLFPYAPGRLGTGNNMAFRADVLRAIGGFDPCLGVGSPTHSGEDLAAFIRALWAGSTLVYQPGALVRHHHRDTYGALRRQVYGYGVGLSACMISCLSHRPRMLADFAARVPRGLRYLVSPSSAKNQRRTTGYPRRLAVAEAMGLAYGPFAYARARMQRRRRDGRGSEATQRAADVH